MQTEEKAHKRFEREVREAAYYLWRRRGEMGWPGDAVSDWLHGEAQVEQISRLTEELRLQDQEAGEI